MKLVAKSLERDLSGHVSIIPEESEDLWHIYNLIIAGDHVRATTWRKIVREGATGSVSSDKVKLTLTIEVSGVDFDPGSEVLRLSGRNVSENQHVKMGAHHTIELELNRKLHITKAYWDSVALERLENACDPSKHAEVAAVVMAEGLAHVCLITSAMTIVRARIEHNIPRKKKIAMDQHKKAVNKFYEQILQALIRHVDFAVIKCVILASPGFTREQCWAYITDEAVRRDIRTIIENKSKFILCHSHSGHKQALNESLMQPEVQAKLADTKAVSEVKALEEFFEMMKLDPDRAFYGIGHITKANERSAIGTLLLSDNLFRACDVPTRRRYVELVESVKDAGGQVYIFSSLHVSGEQLAQLGGIAAILRFPLPELDDEDDDA